MMSFFSCKISCISPTTILVLTTFVMLLGIAVCSPPEDPIKCSNNRSDCTITNSYGAFPDRTTCRVAEVVYPASEDELIAAVAAATKNNRKVKVATRYSHSIPKLVCPDGEDGLLISTKNLNKIRKVDTMTGTMTVDSGVTLRQLINESAKAGLALPYAPYWWGLTIGGMMATAAHGSSLWGKGSAIHDHVVGLKMISPGHFEDGYVKVRTLNETDVDFDAAKVSLGVLGVISQVTFQVQPIFKRSITYTMKNDSDLGDQALTFGNQHEFADLTWYPSQRRVLYRTDDRVPLTTKGDALNDFTGFRPTLSSALAVIRSLEENQESRADAEGKCVAAILTTSLLRINAFGLTNNGIVFTGYPVVGYQNRLQSSGTCLDSLNDALITACPWDSRVKGEFFHQTTFTIGMSKVKAFIQDVQRLVSLEPKSFCGTEEYNGILMRYVKASTAYLGKEEDGIDFDMTYYRSKDPLAPRLFEDILEELEQMAMFKYGGLPHWGKNRNLAFEGVIKKYKNGGKFIRVKERFDPQGLFSSEWTNQVLGLKEGLSIVKEGCALEGLCICSQDSHCAPNKGYYCQPGRIYKDARVCSSRKEILT
ncbi:probable L-gulonolactone oxidase 6 [Chenopodium quinoa]|uniref:probable L-gulonolactone oxidase 6 n=1 Tax=Chenopodium quinoa TaxID=63459 RepID=UPI000B776E9D|nr:probable L-gulonolactone oxidase 6 [Chenopodium quinoa]